MVEIKHLICLCGVSILNRESNKDVFENVGIGVPSKELDRREVEYMGETWCAEMVRTKDTNK